MALLLWILAVILVVSGIVAFVRGEALWGIVLVIAGLPVGRGGIGLEPSGHKSAAVILDFPGGVWQG